MHEHGFAVEIWDWAKKDVPALATTGAKSTSITCYISETLVDARCAGELLRTAEQSIPIAHQPGNSSLNIHCTSLDNKGLPVRPCDLRSLPFGDRQ
jgi:hydroxypyruvate isomerase